MKGLKMSGFWIYPWKGEKIRGRVVQFAPSGNSFICETDSGQRFEWELNASVERIGEDAPVVDPGAFAGVE
jgi:hypothetical protein